MPPKLALVKLPPLTTIHKLGSASLTPESALLRFGQPGWTIPYGRAVGSAKAEGWAILGDSEGRRLAVETLLSRYRIHPAPPPPGAFPYITSLLTSSSPASTSSSPAPPLDAPTPSRPIRHLAFARPPASGEFTDFTARYGALQEEDRLTFRETLQGLHPTPSSAEIGRVARLMRIEHLLDLPGVSFSSGQTRRGRIAAALLTRPVLLLLEDPMAGLDIHSRADVSAVLGELNTEGDIRVVLVLRGKGDGLPDWVTHVAEVKKGEVWVGERTEWESEPTAAEREGGAKLEVVQAGEADSGGASAVSKKARQGASLVELNGVTVSYGEGTREVLKGIDWTIREGEKWHLQGSNGSGKTTLLSLILGHHPRSFSLPPTSLRLFSKPRREIPTPTLRGLIGHTSPEIYAAFPRGMGLSAGATVGTGFEGVFSRRNLSPEQKKRVFELLDYCKEFLIPARAPANRGAGSMDLDQIARTNFAHFTPPQQALLLFLRALAGRPKLVILDEPSQGVDEGMWARCVELLRKEWEERPDMSTVVVTHYEDEVPWTRGEGRMLRLQDGRAEAA